MTGIWRRRALLPVLATGVALVTSACIDFTGTKVIQGDAPPGAEFVVEITCEHETAGTIIEEEFVYTGEGTMSTPFPGHELPPGNTTCTITETEDAGAVAVTYECGPIAITPVDLSTLDLGTEADAQPQPGDGGPGMSAPQLGDGPTTATCAEFSDRLEIDIFMASAIFPSPIGEAGDSEIEVQFTVTNDFGQPTTTTAAPTTTTAPPAPAAAAPVAAQPTFTG